MAFRRPQALMAAVIGLAIDAFFADHDEAAAPRFSSRPGAIELLAEALADALHQKPHRLAGHLEKALHAQHVMRARDERRACATKAAGSSIAGSSTTKLSKSS